MRTLLVAMVALVGCGLQEHPQGGAGGVGGDPFGGGSDFDAAAAGTGGSGAVGGGGVGGAANPGGNGGSRADASAGRDAALPDTAAPSTDPGAGLTLGGTFVPRDKAIVIIHFGHSNMAGRALTPEELHPYFYTPQPHLWSYLGGGHFEPAVEPTAPDDTPGQGAGPGMALLRAAAALAGPDYHFISIARGRNSATTVDFQKGGLYYSTFTDRAKELRGRVTFGAVVVMLGITDRHLPFADQAGFADRMQKIVADLRADLGEPTLPILHTDYEVESTGELNVNSDYAKLIRPLILSLPTKITRCAIVPTDGTPMFDDHHFDMAGHKLWAGRAIDLLVKNAWAPWGR